MKSPVVKFIAGASILTVLCIVLQIIWNQQAPAEMVLSKGFWLLGVFATVTTLVHLFLLNALKNSPQAFVRSYIGALGFKFFLFLMMLIVLLMFSGDNQRALILHFLFYYAVFTILEVSMLYGEMKKIKPTGSQ